MADKISYDCAKCPAYCCSYDRIEVSKRDLTRVANFFRVSTDRAERLFTKVVEGERVLRHKRDPLYGSVCQFLDIKTRRCTVHEARPQVCRDYPGQPSCGYYDFLRWERRHQDVPDFVPLSGSSPSPPNGSPPANLKRVRPARKPRIPRSLAGDFDEALKVLPVSPMSSATIIRRLLQRLIREEYGIQRRSLAEEIEAFAEEVRLPAYLKSCLDAVRQTGNIAAHPSRDEETGAIVAVRREEAKWLLQVVEALFDFLYVKPTLLERGRRLFKAKIAALHRSESGAT